MHLRLKNYLTLRKNALSRVHTQSAGVLDEVRSLEDFTDYLRALELVVAYSPWKDKK